MSRQKNICYLSYDGITDPLGQSQILPYLLKLNKNTDLNFTIISFEKKSNRQKISNQQKVLSKENIFWLPLSYTKYPPIISTLFDIFKLNLAIKKLNYQRKISLIHCRSYITSLSGLKFKAEDNIPFIFDMRGLYADERLDGKIWNKKNIFYYFIYKYFKKKEKQFLTESAHTISLTFSGKKELKSWKLQNLSPISVIPCCTDEDLFKLDNVKFKRNQLGIDKNDFVISYIGSIGTWYMLDEMLDFFNVLKRKMPDSKFLFITKDNPIQVYKKCSKKSIPKNSILIKESSREIMPSYISASNFSIFFILPYFSKKASSPTKMGEIMNLGVPINCNTGVGDVDKVINECMPELLVKGFNNQEYQRITNLISSNYKFESSKIIQTSHKNFSLNKGVKKYADIYTQILNKKT